MSLKISKEGQKRRFRTTCEARCLRFSGIALRVQHHAACGILNINTVEEDRRRSSRNDDRRPRTTYSTIRYLAAFQSTMFFCLVTQRTSMPTVGIKFYMRRGNFGEIYEASINISNLVYRRCSVPARPTNRQRRFGVLCMWVTHTWWQYSVIIARHISGMPFVEIAGFVLACYARGEKTGHWPQTIENVNAIPHVCIRIREQSATGCCFAWPLLRYTDCTWKASLQA